MAFKYKLSGGDLNIMACDYDIYVERQMDRNAHSKRVA